MFGTLVGPINNCGEAFFDFLLVNVNNVFHGASGRNRTYSLQIRSLLPYPFGHRRMFGPRASRASLILSLILPVCL